MRVAVLAVMALTACGSSDLHFTPPPLTAEHQSFIVMVLDNDTILQSVALDASNPVSSSRISDVTGQTGARALAYTRPLSDLGLVAGVVESPRNAVSCLRGEPDKVWQQDAEGWREVEKNETDLVFLLGPEVCDRSFDCVDFSVEPQRFVAGSQVQGLAALEDGRFFVAALEGRYFLASPEGPVEELEAFAGIAAHSAAVDSNGTIWVGSKRGELFTFDLTTETATSVQLDTTFDITAVSWSPDGRRGLAFAVMPRDDSATIEVFAHEQGAWTRSLRADVDFSTDRQTDIVWRTNTEAFIGHGAADVYVYNGRETVVSADIRFASSLVKTSETMFAGLREVGTYRRRPDGTWALFAPRVTGRRSDVMLPVPGGFIAGTASGFVQQHLSDGTLCEIQRITEFDLDLGARSTDGTLLFGGRDPSSENEWAEIVFVRGFAP